jgi:hypothetical protein
VEENYEKRKKLIRKIKKLGELKEGSKEKLEDKIKKVSDKKMKVEW